MPSHCPQSQDFRHTPTALTHPFATVEPEGARLASSNPAHAGGVSDDPPGEKPLLAPGLASRPRWFKPWSHPFSLF